VVRVGSRHFSLAGAVSLAPEPTGEPEPAPAPGAVPLGMGAARPVAAR